MDCIKVDYTTAHLTPMDLALCFFAVKLTLLPGGMSRDDVDDLHSAGLSDRMINDTVQIVAYFNYINRVADGLGVDLEPGMAPSPL